jgi:hypothetical protein
MPNFAPESVWSVTSTAAIRILKVFCFFWTTLDAREGHRQLSPPVFIFYEKFGSPGGNTIDKIHALWMGFGCRRSLLNMEGYDRN